MTMQLVTNFNSGPGCSLLEYPLRAGGRGFESRPRYTKGIKMVPVATFLGAQHI